MASGPMTAATYEKSELRIRGLGSAFGAEVRGLAWGIPASAVVKELTIALRRHLLLVMRGMPSPTHDQLDEFFRPFGRLLLETRDGTFHYGKFTGDDQVVVHRKSDGNYVVSTDMGAKELGWHNDQFHKPQLKILSVLEAIEFEPGSTPTRFRDMYTAYEMLPAAMRAELEHKQSINFDPKLPGPEELPRLCDAMHPIFTAHPHSGRRALYICDFTAGIAGMDPARSDALLTQLRRHADDNAPQYVHQWEVGDIVMWDNVGVQHSRDAIPPRQCRRLRVYEGVAE
jgi:alpha-ketoglutarate-dependent taurine dioxygenase